MIFLICKSSNSCKRLTLRPPSSTIGTSYLYNRPTTKNIATFTKEFFLDQPELSGICFSLLQSKILESPQPLLIKKVTKQQKLLLSGLGFPSYPISQNFFPQLQGRCSCTLRTPDHCQGIATACQCRCHFSKVLADAGKVVLENVMDFREKICVSLKSHDSS